MDLHIVSHVTLLKETRALEINKEAHSHFFIDPRLFVYLSCESISCCMHVTQSHMNMLVKSSRDTGQESVLGQKLKTFVLCPEDLYNKDKTVRHRCPHLRTHDHESCLQV